MKKLVLFALAILVLHSGISQVTQAKEGIKISADGRYFEYADGSPFFWLGDTGWLLFSRLTKAEIKHYLDNRKAKGINVIHASLIGEFDANRKSRYGQTSLINEDPLQPNDKFYALVDSVIYWCQQRNMFMALVCTWGSKVVNTGDGKVIFDSTIAYKYGKWLGARYKKFNNIVWFLGGDVPVIKNGVNYIGVWRAMAKGIRDGGNKSLMTYHPNGYKSSSLWLHNEAWLDFNTIQTSHGRRNAPVWDFIRKDRSLEPIKPTLDAEPNYEDHPVNPWPKWNTDSGYFRAYDVRKQLYRCVFAGSAGVSYGHQAIWQFLSERDEVVNYADRGWINALDRPGAFQAGYMRRLVESRPLKGRMPDTTMVGSGTDHAQHMEAYHGASNDFAMIYIPVGKTISVNTSFFTCDQLTAWWFNPRDASVQKIGTMARKNEMEFTPPTTGEENDWVLVLDNPDKKFATPGKH